MNHRVQMTKRLILSSWLIGGLAMAQDPLPSWNDSASKAAVMAFVGQVTDENGPGYVPPAERIATFDNDGCLWSEQPFYFQGIWALDRIRQMAPEHPEWNNTEPYASVLRGDLKGAMAGGEGPLLNMLTTAHAGVTADQFRQLVSDWLDTAKHPTTGLRYDQMVFQPMLELLNYLRDNGFKTYIVSGGGIDFLRVFAERVYGIPPEQVVGTTADVKYELVDGIPTIIKQGRILHIDDKAGKPIGIYRHIGRRPIFAAGNSDGDLAMLEYTTIPRNADDTTPRLGFLIHHTDGQREFAYDRESHMGRLDKGLDEAAQRGWHLVDMKNDWNAIYPAQ